LPERLKPAVRQHWLLAIAGAVWTGAALMLLRYAVVWLLPVAVPLAVALAVAGAVLGAVATRYVFLGIARRNIVRIEEGPDIACAFSFQAWRSYVVMFAMIALGVTLRRSGVLPHPVLAVVYEAIGVALLAASILYHRRFFETDRG